MRKITYLILLFIIGGLIGFSINFTFSFRQNSIILVYAAFVYAITGFVQQRRIGKLIDYENVLLFWYILFLVVYACIYNYSWVISALLCVCFVAFLIGYYSALLWNKKHIGKIIAALWIIMIAVFDLVFIPWLTFKESINVSKVGASPEIKLVDLQKGIVISKGDLKGKTVFLDFWNVHCGPCIRSFPLIEQLYEHYKNDTNVRVYLVDCGIDSLADVKDFISEEKVKTPVLYDSGEELTKELKIRGFPFHIILDSKGTVRFNHLGFNKDEADVFVKEMITEIDKVKNE